MRAIAVEIEPPRVAAAPVLWTLPDRGIVGMVSFIIAESAIFTIFVVAYLFYRRKEPDRTDSARRPRGPDLLHDLPALEQRDDSSGRKTSRTR